MGLSVRARFEGRWREYVGESDGGFDGVSKVV